MKYPLFVYRGFKRPGIIVATLLWKTGVLLDCLVTILTLGSVSSFIYSNIFNPLAISFIGKFVWKQEKDK